MSPKPQSNSAVRRATPVPDDILAKSVSTRILLVDDDEYILRILGRILTAQEWQIDTASNAVEAVLFLESNDYYAVITDYEMPGENGIWLLEQVKLRQPNSLRVLASGSGDSFYESISSSLIQQFIAKPIEKDTLLGALEPDPINIL